MAKGISIHIGLNQVNAAHYGTSADLPYCINDAEAMKNLALNEGYQVLAHLLNKNANSTNVVNALNKAAQQLEKGDILLITYSGHGSYFPDLNGDEKDRYDETWVLYDRMFLDDELYFAWSKFRQGVRILLISDSCHSGTVAKPLLLAMDNRRLDLPSQCSLSEMLKAESQLLYKRHKNVYDPNIKHIPRPTDLEIPATVILLAACNDNQLAGAASRRGKERSLFTDEMLTVYKRKNTGNYNSFLKAIRQRIPESRKQTPCFYQVGAPNKKFVSQRPFAING